MWDRGTRKINHVRLLACSFGSLTHRIWYGICLSDTHGNGSALITHNHCDAKLKAAPTFNYLCNACNFNNAFLELVLPFEILLFFLFEFCHLYLHISLKLQAAFTRTICKRLNASNIAVTTAVKNNRFNIFVLGTFSDQLANQFGLFSFFQSLHFLSKVAVYC